jgi:UDP-N-acetylmuramoyl-L-alanyl-D-glutamate--2,6-diaminopimelate ligase
MTPTPRTPRPRHVRPRTLMDVAAHLHVEPVEPAPAAAGRPTSAEGTLVTGLTLDSRSVRPGDLYAGLPGARAHGAGFAGDAAASGAAALLTDPAGMALAGATGLPAVVVDDPRGRLGELAAWVYGEPAEALTMLGVTGTNGKTTVAHLLDAGLRAAGRRTGLLGTVQTRLGDEVLPSVRTTPEAPDLQALLALMREQQVSAVSMEVSSHALVLGRVDGVVFDVAAFTNLSQDHLDFHGDLESYFAAKAELFTPARARRAVVDVDDAYGARLADGAQIPVVTVSAAGRPDADWRAADVRPHAGGSVFTAIGPYGEAAASVRLPGSFNVANALLAIAVLATAGVPFEQAVTGVAACTGVPGRMERVEVGQPFLAVVDYAHTPEAVASALRELRPLTEGRLVVVLGCGGDRDAEKRPLMGRAAAELADLAVLTSDNPRSERPEAILAAMQEGAAGVPSTSRAQVAVEPDRRAAIEQAVRGLRAGDAVAVLGKGHETGQETAGRTLPFDDRVELAEAIRAARAAQA